MRFGFHIGQQNIDIADLRRLWSYADGHGYHWVSVWDHFYCRTDSSDPHFEAIALMAAMASETKAIQIGCLVFAAAYRNPGLLAKSLVTIDHLSNGRCHGGLGAGWHEPEYHDYGYPFLSIGRRMDQLEEAAIAVRWLLDPANETVTFQGEFVQLDHAYANPKPLQRPLPLWIGGLGEKRSLRITARYADGWNAAYIGPDVWAHKNAVLERWCEREGRDPASLDRSLNLMFYMAADEAGVPAADEKMAAQVQEEFDKRRPGSLTGSPQQAIERIGEYQRAGVDWINLAIRPPVDWDAVQAFTEEVIPAFR